MDMHGFETGTGPAVVPASGRTGSYTMRLTGNTNAGYERWPWRLESTVVDGQVEVRVWLAKAEVIRVRGPRGVIVDLLDAATELPAPDVRKPRT
jgi:hypothetical protein